MNTKEMVDMPFIEGKKYVLTIVEEYSRYSSTFPKVRKEEAYELVPNFIRKIEQQPVT